MSQENVEVAQAFLAAWNAGDREAVRETLDADVVIGREMEGWPEPGPHVGREVVMRQWERIREPWGDAITLVPMSIVDAGDRVVTRQIVHAVARGPEVHAEFTTVSRLRNGRIFLIDYYWNYAEALEAVGLSEQDAHADS
jgi:ketosteroid isomerase-like protein